MRQHSCCQRMQSLISKPFVHLHQYVRVKFLPHRKDAVQSSHADLAAEDTDKVHESAERGCLGGARQSARFESFEDDAAHQPDVSASQGGGHQKFYELKAVSRPRTIHMGPE